MKKKQKNLMPPEGMCRLFANPFYCLGDGVNGIFLEKHAPLVSEETWIKAGANLISEIGAEKYLKHLLENLKGNYQ